MYFDGSLKLGGGGAGVLFIIPRGEQLKYVFQILFEVSNNEAEYKALLHRLRLAISLGIKRLLIYSDSLLVVQQVSKEWDINKDTMDAYVMEIRKLENRFSGLEIHHVICDNNMGADVLSKLGSDRATVPPGVFVHEFHHPSIRAPDSSSIAQGSKEPDREVLTIEVDWWVAFIEYIQEHKLPPGIDPKSAGATRILWRSKGYSSRGQRVQAWISLRHTHEVCQHGGGQRNTPRDSRRRVREPRGFSHTIRQAILIWFLLAHCFGRCQSTRSLVYQLPILWQKASCSSS
jgi:ribonuclease HI